MNNQPLANIIRKIAWGYIISLFNINMSYNTRTINLIPNWVGSFLLYQALTPLSKYEKSVELLKPLQLIVVIYDLMLWCLALGGIPFDIYLVRVIFTIIDVYFNFQLMTNIATIAKENGYVNAERMLTLRNFKVIIITIAALPLNWTRLTTITFPVVLNGSTFIVTLIAIVYAVFSFGVEMGIIYYLFHYAKYEDNRASL